MGSKPPVPAHERFTYITKLNDAWDDIETGSLANTSAVMEGLWLFKRRGRYFLFGSHLSGYAPNGERNRLRTTSRWAAFFTPVRCVADNFYLTSDHIMGPWTNQGLFAPRGSNTYNSQTFKGLTISGPKGQVFIYIGHRYMPHGGPPFCKLESAVCCLCAIFTD